MRSPWDEHLEIDSDTTRFEGFPVPGKVVLFFRFGRLSTKVRRVVHGSDAVSSAGRRAIAGTSSRASLSGRYGRNSLALAKYLARSIDGSRSRVYDRSRHR